MWPPLFVCLALRTEAQVEHKPSGRFFMSSAERSIHHQVKPPTKQASLPIKFTSYAFSTEGIINNCQKYFFFPKIFLSPNMIAATMFNFFDVQETKKSIQPLSEHHRKKKNQYTTESGFCPAWTAWHTAVPWWMNSMTLVPRGHTPNNLENGYNFQVCICDLTLRYESSNKIRSFL